MSADAKPLDLDAVRARADAASPGPWLDGDAWLVAGVGFRNNSPGRCGYCHLGEPVWSGRCEINGEIMQAHRHLDPDPWGSGHIISSADGGTVAGMYDYEKGGIVDPADQEFIRHARTDVPALLAEVERLRASALPAPTEVRVEYAAWCHGEDRDGIRLDQGGFRSREQAAWWGDEQIGRYGITGYRVMRREHHVFAEGSRYATAITAWVEDTEEER